MSFVINVLSLLIHLTSAEFNLNSSNTTTKSLDTFNQNKITLNNTWDYREDDDDDDPIIRHTLQAKAKEIEKLLLNTTRRTTATRITTESLVKYLTNQESLRGANMAAKQPKEEHANKNYYQNSNHFYHYLTTIKFNKRNNENNYDNFTFSHNELKTITTTSIYGKNDAKEIRTLNETDVKESAVGWLEREQEGQRRKNKKDSYQAKYQTKYYAAPANSFGQMPQFQLQAQQLQLYLHQQPATAAAAASSLLPHEYHQLPDYRLFFNAAHHTQFYLHTLATTTTTTRQNDFVTVATKQATAAAAAAASTATFKSFQPPDAHNRYQDDDYSFNDKTSNSEYNKNHDYDTDTAAAATDDDDDTDDDGHDWLENNEMQLLNLTTTGRTLNILTDTIAAVVFGVNTRPVAAIQDIQTEEIELFNGLSLRQSRFNPFNPCRILIHGWLGGSTAGIYNTLVPEYLKLQQGVFNVFTVDWGKGALADYITASYRVKPVAKVVANFIDFLHEESGVSFDNIHVIGFSMGAHVAGIAGKYVRHGRLPVIYGLDPALPLFRFESSAERLDAQDANYVEVIHTSVGSYGYDHPLGHVDFYINFGYNQPGCFFNECSHFTAFKIFAQVLNSAKLRGEQCSSACWWNMIRHKRCERRLGNSLIMGVEGRTSRELASRRGVYYVLTNDQAPYKMR